MSVKDINEKGNWKFSFKLLVVGFYFLNFFGWNEKEKNKKVEEIYSFLIQFIGLLSKEELEKLVKKGKVRKGVKDMKFGFERLNIVFDSEFKVVKVRIDIKIIFIERIFFEIGDMVKSR